MPKKMFSCKESELCVDAGVNHASYNARLTHEVECIPFLSKINKKSHNGAVSETNRYKQYQPLSNMPFNSTNTE